MSSTNNYLQKVALIGASGNIGAPTLKHLLAINKSIHITIVSRPESTATFPSSPQVTVKRGSYDDPAFLQDAFAGQDAVMIALGFFATDSQPKLIEAAAKAGVKWILPNEYGGDGTKYHLWKSVPLVHPKIAATQQLNELSKSYTGLKWIGVATGPWMELSLQSGLFGIHAPSKTATIYTDSTPFSTSSLSQGGLGIAKLLSLPLSSLETYSNRFVYISSFLITQTQLFDAVKRATGTSDSDWSTSHSTIEERKKAAEAKLVSEGDPMLGADLMYAYYMSLEGDFESKAQADRKVLGMQEENLDDVVRQILSRPSE